MQISAPIYHLKRRAKRMSKEQNIPLHAALDRIAQDEGYRAWSHLSAAYSEQSPAKTILDALHPSEMLLLGARPQMGKTVLALELAVLASKQGERARFYTLDYTQADVNKQLAALGGNVGGNGFAPFGIDTSDEISAAYIMETAEQHAATFIVVDYLQLLDQNRNHPLLQDQLARLRIFATQTETRIVLVSQIDRQFDLTARPIPEIADVRLPNPADLGLIDKACFLHEGAMDLVTL